MIDPAKQVRFDRNMYTVELDGRIIYPSHTEFVILDALASRPGVVKTRNELLKLTSGGHADTELRAIDSHIKRLRAKGFDQIKTRREFGYYWAAT